MFSFNTREKKRPTAKGAGGTEVAVQKNNELILLDCSLVRKGAETVLLLKLGRQKPSLP